MTSKAATLDLRQQIVQLLPNLRAFARTLTNNHAQADDLVQETVVKALANLGRFQEGTNLNAWLFTILRNTYYSELRKRRREVEDPDDIHAGSRSVAPDQIDALQLKEFRAALARLPDEQREALILVGASGFAYEEAAAICGVAVGTIKSRVNRARRRLAQLLDYDQKTAAE